MTFCSPECARGEKPSEAAVVAVAPAVTEVATEVVEASAPEAPIATAPIAARVDADVRASDFGAPSRSRKRVILAAVGTRLAAGVGGAIVEMVSPGRSMPVSAAQVPLARPAPAAAPEPPAAPAPPTKEAMLA